MDIIYNTYVVIYFSIAAIMDYKWRKIKNWLIIVGLFSSIIFYFILKRDILQLVYGFLLPFPLFLFYHLKMIGAGDIKLLSVAGSILGYEKMIDCLLMILIFAVILVILNMHKRIINKSKGLSEIESIPLAVAISFGIIVGVLGG